MKESITSAPKSVSEEQLAQRRESSQFAGEIAELMQKGVPEEIARRFVANEVWRGRNRAHLAVAKRERDQAMEDSYVDQLTGLRNKKWVDCELSGIIFSSERGGDPLSIAIIDLDGMKAINDEWGHGAGDKALASFARVLQEVMHRESDVLVRLGGDEFLVVARNTPAQGVSEQGDHVGLAGMLAREIDNKIGENEVLSEYQKIIGSEEQSSVFQKIRSKFKGAPPDDRLGKGFACSIGVVQHATQSMDELLEEADKAMYEAKADKGDGRSRVVVYGPAALIEER